MSDEAARKGRKVTHLTPQKIRASQERRQGRRIDTSKAGPYQLPDAPPEPGDLYDTDEPVLPDEAWSHENILESETYSKSMFYTQASHGDETTRQVKASLSNSVMRLMSAIVEQRRFPQIGTKSDIVRDAIHHRLHDYALMLNSPQDAELTSRIEKSLSIAALSSSLQLEQELFEQSRGLYEDVKQRVESLRSAGNLRGAVRVLERAASELDNMEEPWASRLREFVEENQQG